MEFKDETNAILNRARRFKYEDPGDAIVQMLDANIYEIAAKLSPTARSIFDLDKTKKDGALYVSSSRRVKLYTIAALFFHPNGSVRLRPDTGAVPGKTWLRRNVLHTSPFHFRGGIARSNIYWHAGRNYFINQLGTRKAGPGGKVLSHYQFTEEQDMAFRKHRRDFMKAIMELMTIFGNMARQRVPSANAALD